MSFSLDNQWVWDFWLADDGDLFHMFYLHAPKSLGDPELRHRNARFGHATSNDLTTWTDHGVAFGAGSPGDFDDTATWTGSVVRGEDGLWRMFYTGSHFPDPEATTNIETVGVATSPDLFTWTKAPGPIAVADARWYEKLGDTHWPEEAWRDPWVFADPGGDGWHMLVTARASDGPVDDRGVIGHATSADLENWYIGAALSATGAGFEHLEVPQIVEVGGQVHLLFSCDAPKLVGRRRGERGGVFSLPVSNAAGPYALEKARLLVDDGLYSGRLIQDRFGDWQLLAFDAGDASGDFVGRVSDPRRVASDPVSGWLVLERAVD